MKNKLYMTAIPLLFISLYTSAQKTGTFKDKRNKETYKTVQIGQQIWMAENLAFKADSGCYAYKDSIEYVETYGYLYTWNTAQKVCPSGWHLPSDEEWAILEKTLGMSDTYINDNGFRGGMVGGRLKETGTTHWAEPNKDATNESGFAGLPGGYRTVEGRYFDKGNVGVWWSSTEREEEAGDFEEAPETPAIIGCYRGLDYDYNSVAKNCMDKKISLSIRCVKD